LETFLLPRPAWDKYKETLKSEGVAAGNDVVKARPALHQYDVAAARQACLRVLVNLALSEQSVGAVSSHAALQQALEHVEADAGANNAWFHIETIVLPRQARGKHRENSKKRGVFYRNLYAKEQEVHWRRKVPAVDARGRRPRHRARQSRTSCLESRRAPRDAELLLGSAGGYPAGA
jgi:hypothetical protein